MLGPSELLGATPGRVAWTSGITGARDIRDHWRPRHPAQFLGAGESSPWQVSRKSWHPEPHRPAVRSVGPMSTTSDRRCTATVIGGGPAGLMAAEVLAGAGCEVTVHDHMASVGRKLLLAGRGGLNITHSEPTDEMLERYGPARARLESAVRRWPASALRAWCSDLGEPTFVGSSGRVFPKSFRATPLLRAWLARLAAAGVTFETRHRFVGFGSSPTAVQLDTPTGRREVTTDVVVLALGGASWPRVGSDGAWVPLLRAADVRVSSLRPANCGWCVATA